MRRAQFIEELVKERGWTKGVELGVKDGATFLHLLQRCPNLSMVGVDLWEVRYGRDLIEGGESYEGWNMMALEAGVRAQAHQYGPRAMLLKMHTVAAAEVVGPADFVFIDADHTYQGVINDIEAWKDHANCLIFHDWDWDTVQDAITEKFVEIRLGPDNLAIIDNVEKSYRG